MSELTSRQRIRAAMRHEMPDRVPVMCQLALGHYFLFSGRDPVDIWFDSATFVAALETMRAEYGFDGYLVNLPGRPANWRDWLASCEPTMTGWQLRWHDGLQTAVPRDDNAHTFLPDGETLPHADYNAVDIDDPATYRTPGYVWNTWHAPSLWDIPADADLTDPASYPAWFTAALRQARALSPAVSVHAEVFSPFTHLLELFGYQSALMALIEAPNVCHRLLEVFTAVVQAQVTCYAAHDPDAVLVSSAFAGAGFISREMYREFVVPCESRVYQTIHQHNLPAYVHTCGAIGDRLDLMSEAGMDGIDTLDPPPLGTVNLAEVKQRYGQRFFFKGNLDAVNEMLHADDAGFDRAVLQRLRVGMPGSGYILSSACSVAPHVKPARLKRMVALTALHGRYRESQP